ncbi:MAG: hypothetical protein ABJA67_03915 [Chthonomonadales bacterium]
MRYLNGFVLIGIMLLAISIAGAATGNRLLTEPGQQVNPYAWLEYLGASALMLVNGAVSIRNARQQEAEAESHSKSLAPEKPVTEPTESTEIPE